MLQIFVFTNQLLQSFIPSLRATKFYWEKYAKTCLVDHPLFLQGKLLWTRLLIGNRQIGANPSSEMMLVIFFFLLFFRQYQLVCTQEWQLDFAYGKLKPRQNKMKSFENMVMLYL